MHKGIKALRQALDDSGIPYKEVDGFENAVSVAGCVFMYGVTPFNTDSAAYICRDKAMLHRILEGKVRMPRTVSAVDPNGQYPQGITAETLDESFRKSSGIPYPRIVKMNSGDMGRNVYRVDDEAAARAAVAAIFNKSSKDYDFVALIQEYVPCFREIRAMVAGGRMAFVYDRGTFAPVDAVCETKIVTMCQAILGELRLSWCALDFIESETGELFFVEANTRPGFEGFVAANGDGQLVEAYKAALKNFLKK